MAKYIVSKAMNLPYVRNKHISEHPKILNEFFDSELAILFLHYFIQLKGGIRK